MSESLTHFDEAGQPRMVDVGDKPIVDRSATASGVLRIDAETLRRMQTLSDLPKGDPLTVARISAVQAVKRTPELIPMCHTVSISGVDVQMQTVDPESTRPGIRCRVVVHARDRTGVEMEALVGASVALLTLYDMLKAIDKGMELSSIRLEEKTKSS